ncbi:MAG: DUF1707 domain-containing protein [Spirochaetia bacterium]
MNDMTDPNKRVTEAERNTVIQQLQDSFAQNIIDMDEFDKRIAMTENAVTKGELQEIVRDLPEPEQDRVNTVKSSETSRTPKVREAGGFILNVFSGTDRKGVWRPAEETSVISVFGGSDIDLRKAVFAYDTIYIHTVSVFGGTDIIIPPGVNVDVRGIGIFGGFDSKGTEYEYPDGPTVIVDGVAVFGGTDVVVKD